MWRSAGDAFARGGALASPRSDELVVENAHVRRRHDSGDDPSLLSVELPTVTTSSSIGQPERREMEPTRWSSVARELLTSSARRIACDARQNPDAGAEGEPSGFAEPMRDPSDWTKSWTA